MTVDRGRIRRAGAATSGGSLSTLTGATLTQIPYGTAGGALTSSADFTYNTTTGTLDVAKSLSGSYVSIKARNTSNTVSSGAVVLAEVAGASADDAVFRASVAGVTTWTWGIDNSDSDKWKIAAGTDVGTSTLMAISTAGLFAFNTTSPDAAITYDFREASAGLHCHAQFKASNNSVGALIYINNSTANTLLEVRANGGAVGGTIFGVSRNTTTSITSQTNAPLLIGVTGTADLVFGTNNVERFRASSAGLITFKGAATVASASSAVWDVIDFTASTLTLTGSTNVTTAAGVNFAVFRQPTITDSSALTVDQAATVYIANAPAAGGSVTITNKYALWVDAGLVRMDGNGTHVWELPADATGNASAATGRIPIKIGAATKYFRYFDD